MGEDGGVLKAVLMAKEQSLGGGGAACLPSVVGAGWGVSFVSRMERENKQGHLSAPCVQRAASAQSPQPPL